MSSRIRSAALFLGLALALAATEASYAQSYVAVDLGTLGGNASGSDGLNNLGPKVDAGPGLSEGRDPRRQRGADRLLGRGREWPRRVLPPRASRGQRAHRLLRRGRAAFVPGGEPDRSPYILIR